MNNSVIMIIVFKQTLNSRVPQSPNIGTHVGFSFFTKLILAQDRLFLSIRFNAQQDTHPCATLAFRRKSS